MKKDKQNLFVVHPIELSAIELLKKLPKLPKNKDEEIVKTGLMGKIVEDV